MAEKTSEQEKKTRRAKTTPAKKTLAAKMAAPAKKASSRTATRQKAAKGDRLVCDVCGLSVIVDELGNVMETQEIICCGEPMKPKTTKTRAAKK